ncbi:MAG: hypothetical protein NTV34_13990 [Proteobacteria bacterium]|nr:hypothetical protein [Pseudomonadota bacterium]
MKSQLLKLVMMGFGAAVVSSVSLAEALDTPSKATKVKTTLAPALSAMEGVNGYGISGCDPTSGQKDVRGDFVHCINIMTSTRESEGALLTLFPVGKKIQGVFISVDYIGDIVIQPRASGGN